MNLPAYLQRINYTGSLNPDLDTLKALHRAHLYSIPYENLDIHYGRYLPLDENYIFEKLVTRRRGGWCYEMNGLFAGALRRIGFEVNLLASAVGRKPDDNSAERNHLILLVELDQPYLVDVGFGNGLLEPIPLQEGTYNQWVLTYHLTNKGNRWFFKNRSYGGDGFDFTVEPHTLADFTDKCHELQTSPDSGFVRTTVCHRFTPDSLLTLRGAVLRTITESGSVEETLDTPERYQQVLTTQFDLWIDDFPVLWEKVRKRHSEWLAQNT